MHRAGCEEVNYNPACKPGREGGGRAPLAQGWAHPVRFPPPRCRLALRSPVTVAALRDELQLRRGVPLPVCCGARLGSAVPGYEVEIEVLVTQRVLVGQLGSLHGGELRHGAGGSPAAFLPLQLSLSPTSAGCMQAALSQPGAGGGRTLRHGVGQPPLAVAPQGCSSVGPDSHPLWG